MTADQGKGPRAMGSSWEQIYDEPFGRRIMEAAIAENRSADVLNCLSGGGSVTLSEGCIALATAAQLADMWNRPPGEAE